MEPTKRHSRIVKWSLIVGIVIVLNLFYTYALNLIFTQPQFENFCRQTPVVSEPTTQQSCLASGGQWNENIYPDQVVENGNTVTKPVNNSYCNVNFTCQNNYDAAYKEYSRNIFISLVVLGVITLGLGLFLKTAEAITIALSLGGVLTLIIASIRYWSYADNILKVIILALALASLIVIGARKFSDQ